jgi:hypothetical protein
LLGCEPFFDGGSFLTNQIEPFVENADQHFQQKSNQIKIRIPARPGSLPSQQQTQAHQIRKQKTRKT